MASGNEHVAWAEVDGKRVEIVGCFDETTPEKKFDFYDLFLDGVCINEGEPCHEYPTPDDIRAFLELHKALN